MGKDDRDTHWEDIVPQREEDSPPLGEEPGEKIPGEDEVESDGRLHTHQR